MTEYICEKTSLWDYLHKATKPIVLYGMGDGAIKIMNVCKSYDVEISGIFASDEFVRGHSFLGYKVESLVQIEERLGDFIILLAFGVDYDEMLDRIFAIAAKHEVYAPDVPVVGGELFTAEYFSLHKAEFDKVYDMLADDKSKTVFSDMINYKISGKLDYLRRNMGQRTEDFADILRFGDRETYVDLGAYDGDTILEFAGQAGAWEKIYALEPNPKNFKKLLKTVEENALPNVCCVNKGSFSRCTELNFAGGAGRNCAAVENGGVTVEVTDVDTLLDGACADYIKMDVEGAEEETILGCSGTIRRYAPKLSIAAYHRSNDLFRLPLLVHSLCGDYKLYLRRHKYIPAWEIILYAVK